MRRILCILIFMSGFTANAQLLRDNKIVDTLLNYTNFYSPNLVKFLKLRDNTILMLRPHGAMDTYNSYTPYGRYDSIETVRYTLTGTKINDLGFKLKDSCYINDLTQTADGNILLAGSTQDSTIFILLDSSGNFLYAKLYPLISAGMSIKKIYPLYNNSLLVFSAADSIEGMSDCFITASNWIHRHNYLSRIDKDGNLLWNIELHEDKIIDFASLYSLSIPNIINHTDNSFSLIKNTQQEYDDSLKIEYMNFDENGTILNKKNLTSNVISPCNLYSRPVYYTTDSNFNIIITDNPYNNIQPLLKLYL